MKTATSTASQPIADWLARFAAALATPATADWSKVFAAECYWRDLLSFTWDIATLDGRDAIAAMVNTSHLDRCQQLCIG
jgi:putative flavoprotein involved in K+ transport